MAIRASTRPDDRCKIAWRFNDENDSNLVLLTTLRTFSLGFNLQGTLLGIVILEPARNINTLLQAIGRIRRVGQTRQQPITILLCGGAGD
jgi:SNF2 family DNA or RNA helicase